MDLQQNTEFIMTKIDSLMQGAMPYLEKGSEEMIKYKVIEFRSSLILTVLALTIGMVIGLVILKKVISLKKAKEKENKFTNTEGEVIIGIIACVAILMCFIGVIVNVCLDGAKFILSFTSPEVFAITELLGK